MPSVDDALALAFAGWAVLPLAGKIPVTAHGKDDATTDPAKVRAMFAKPHNIGVRIPDSLVVLDFDPRHGGSVQALEEAAGIRLPSTLTVISGRRDGGHHRYYLHPGGQLSASRIPNGIDVKKNTGYCVAPPSLHPDTGHPYEWVPYRPVPLPAQVLALLRPPPPKPFRAPTGRTPAPGPRIDALVRAVVQAGEGRRNELTYWAACSAIRDQLGSAALNQVADAARSVGLDDREIATVMNSARRATGDMS